jgi:hypothetical protein
MNNLPTRLTKLLSNPFVGFAPPWTLMSVLERTQSELTLIPPTDQRRSDERSRAPGPEAQ